MSSSQEQDKNCMLVDLHVHSKYSNRPSQWILRKLDCPESFTEPRLIYERAKAKGMDLVTISDHDCIAGALEIAHLPDVFLSEEVTAYFPEDRCKLHVLALNINEQQHREIQKLRENVFDLVDYLQTQEIVHVLAHPFFAINHLLTWEHLEKLLLLFRHFEINGAREEAQNSCLQQILCGLDARTVEILAEKHRISPRHNQPWQKVLVAGSDDHSSLHIARMHTRVWSAKDMQSCLQSLAQGKCQPQGTPASPRTLAHNLYSIGYQFYRSRFQATEMAAKDSLLQYADCILTGASPQKRRFWNRLPGIFFSLRSLRTLFTEKGKDPSLDMLLQEAQELLRSSPDLLQRIQQNPCSLEREDDWFSLVNSMTNRIKGYFSGQILDALSEAKLMHLFQTVGSAASIYTLLSPYLLAYTIFSRDKQFSRHCLHKFNRLANKAACPDTDLRIAEFTDAFNDVHMAALSLQKMQSFAQSQGMSLSVLTCGQGSCRHGAVNFASQGSFTLPEYPEQVLHQPPLLELLDYCYSQGVTHILASTPGPMGLAALATAKILKLPLYGTYHTALPQYVQERTGDADMESLISKAMLWYYNQMDQVFVPSRAVAESLAQQGVRKDNIQVYPLGIDTGRFHPAKKNGYWKRYFQDSEQSVKLLYVGRLSKEDNLDLLVEAYQRFLSQRKNVKLIIVGDGPLLQALRSELAQAYACSDIFVCPSCADAFRNTVLEAQSSGLPVIVSDQQGPREDMIPGETGFVVPARDSEALARAVNVLLDDPGRLDSMKQKARNYCQARSLEAAFLQHWHMNQNLSRTGSQI